MKLLLAVAAGGALGALARYGVGVWSGRAFGHGFPWATLIVNISGSFVLGALIGYLGLKGHLSPEWRAFLVVGVLGAFTTFSTFSLDATVLAQRGAAGPAILYVAASVAGALFAFWAGLRASRALFG